MSWWRISGSCIQESTESSYFYLALSHCSTMAIKTQSIGSWPPFLMGSAPGEQKEVAQEGSVPQQPLMCILPVSASGGGCLFLTQTGAAQCSDFSSCISSASFVISVWSLNVPLGTSSQMLLMLDPFQSLHFDVRSCYCLSSLEEMGLYFPLKTPKGGRNRSAVLYFFVVVAVVFFLPKASCLELW